MASTSVSKNGATQNLMDKAPWCTRQPVRGARVGGFLPERPTAADVCAAGLSTMYSIVSFNPVGIGRPQLRDNSTHGDEDGIKSDEQGIAMKIYEGLVTFLEVIVLIIKMNLTWLYCVYQFFIPPEPKSVQGEVILITGAGHGMGREVALRLGRLGGTIISVDINPTGNQETIDLIKAEKGKAFRYECDVTDRAAVNAMADKIRREVGEVTMLINNAGIMPCKPVMQHDEKDIKKVFDINIIAHLWLIQAFLPAMKERNHGHIVAMSSMAGILGLRNLVPYCATKFAVRGLMESLHEELREDPRDFSGIKFTCICPYIVDTGLCKNPKIKFPSMMKIVSPQEAADNIVDAIRRNYHEITIPSSLYYVNMFCRALPHKVPMLLKDFLDSGLEAQ